VRPVSSLLLAAALGLSPGAGCALGPAARPTGAPPVAPVALLTEGSAFTRPGMRERIGKTVEQISGRPVLLVDPPERNSDRRRGLAGKLAKENRELAGYDWREPRCAAEATVLAALTSSTDAVYRVTLDAVAHTRPVTPADLRSPAACPRGLGKVLVALHGAEPNAVREESVTGNIALSLFSRSPSAPRVGVEQRATCLEPGAPATLLDLPAIVADALRELPPPHVPEWEAYSRRLLAAGCPLLALSVAEARLGTGPTFKSLQSAALDAMRRNVDRHAVRDLGHSTAAPEAAKSAAPQESALSSPEEPSCSALCSMHMIELCNNDRALWIEHRVLWEATPCGTRRQDAFLEDCYRQQWQSGTFDDACVAPCETTPEGRERLESILRRAGCLPDRPS